MISIVNNVILQDIVWNVNKDTLLKMEFALPIRLPIVKYKMKLHVLLVKVVIFSKMANVIHVVTIVYNVRILHHVINVLLLIFLMDFHVKDVELVVKDVLIQIFVLNAPMGI